MKNNQTGAFHKKDDTKELRSVPTRISQIYDEVTARITSSETEWKEFIVFHSRLYKYSFESAALIYAQRPDATLVADMETWNKKVGRWVNTGAKSIRVFDADESENHSNPCPKTRYLFDVKDTNGNTETIPKVWNLNAATTQMVSDRIKNDFLEEGVPLEIVIRMTAEAKAITGYNELTNGFEEDINRTNLKDLPYAALAVSLNEKGQVDLKYMTSIYDSTPDSLVSELRGQVFLNPEKETQSIFDGWETADEYLSGNVRRKLNVAQLYAEKEPEKYSGNVIALENVQPKDLDASEIDVKLGATWVEAAIYEQFIYELLRTPFYYKNDRSGSRYNHSSRSIIVSYNNYTGSWYIENKSLDYNSIAATA